MRAPPATALVARAAALGGGSVLAVGSRRTTPAVLGAVRAALEAAPMPAALLGGERGAENPYPGLLALADEITVTADSAAMISDAIAAGKPVGLVPVHPAGSVGAWLILARAARRGASSADAGVNPLARIAGRFWSALVRRGIAGWPRDLWFFWREVEERGLAGTADRPARGVPPPPIAESGGGAGQAAAGAAAGGPSRPRYRSASAGASGRMWRSLIASASSSRVTSPASRHSANSAKKNASWFGSGCGW